MKVNVPKYPRKKKDMNLLYVHTNDSCMDLIEINPKTNVWYFSENSNGWKSPWLAKDMVKDKTLIYVGKI